MYIADVYTNGVDTTEEDTSVITIDEITIEEDTAIIKEDIPNTDNISFRYNVIPVISNYRLSYYRYT